MSYNASTVANHFLAKASAEGVPLTPMQLIKLVYIAHGWHLGYFKRPLINEDIHAWKFGPVIDSIYHQVKSFGNSPVTQFLQMPVGAPPVVEDPNSRALLDNVWASYRQYNGLQLSTMTHQPNTPWDLTWNGKGGKFQRSAVIPDAIIQQHYEQLINRVQ